MSSQVRKCINGVCEFVKQNTGELAGAAASVAVNVARGDVAGAIGAVANAKDQLPKLQKDLEAAQQVIQRTRVTLQSMRRRKYKVCNTEALESALKDIEAHMEEFFLVNFNDKQQQSAWTQAQKTLWVDYYRKELSMLMMRISILLNTLNLDVNSLLVTLHLIESEPDKKIRTRKLNELRNSCTR